MLDVPATLDNEKAGISKEALGICKGLKEGKYVLDSVSDYGWKDIKKEKDQILDNDFTIFKGRRK